jgi:SAM-dependent methyltransferase
MLSIEEIKLLIDKLEKVKKEDLQELIDSNLKILKDIRSAVDATNDEEIDRLDKTAAWFREDADQKKTRPVTDELLFHMIRTKIFQFANTPLQNSLEIGPGHGMFSLEFRAWAKNFYLDIHPHFEKHVRNKFKSVGQKDGQLNPDRHVTFYTTRKTDCSNIPQHSVNFIFSWDVFVFFTQNHIQHYLHDIKRVLVPGGHVFIQYANCHYDFDLSQAKRGYWNYNTQTEMERIINEEGYEIVEMNQFRPGANYAIFRKPGKVNPVVTKISEITLD